MNESIFIKKLNKKQLATYFCCSNFDEFLNEMTNCLEADINEDNYISYIDDFIRSHNTWVNSHNEF